MIAGGLQPIALMVLLPLLVLPVLMLYALKKENNRKLNFKKASAELGLEYREKLLPAELDYLSQFPLMQVGRGRSGSNVIVANTEALSLTFFDYRYTVGSGKNRSTSRQSVVLIQSPSLCLPQFVLSPESWIHRIGQLFGLNDINFEADPEFSKRYLLKGASEEQLRDFFTTERRKALMNISAPQIQTATDGFIFFRRSQRVQPAELKVLMEEAFQLHSLFLPESP